VFPISVPPLRDRGDDVLLLAEHFLQRCARQLGRRAAVLDARSRRAVRAYRWPGNVRELQNLVERALILAGDGEPDLAALLPVPVPAGAAEAMVDAAGSGAVATDHDARVLTEAELSALERANLLRALEQSDWRISGAGGAADLLGVPASTLASRLRKHGLKRPRP
jgi:formate hydrogenlyase transcriptional activator